MASQGRALGDLVAWLFGGDAIYVVPILVLVGLIAWLLLGGGRRR